MGRGKHTEAQDSSALDLARNVAKVSSRFNQAMVQKAVPQGVQKRSPVERQVIYSK